MQEGKQNKKQNGVLRAQQVLLTEGKPRLKANTLFMDIHMHTRELNTYKHIFIDFSLQEEKRHKHELREKITSVLLVSSDIANDTW